MINEERKRLSFFRRAICYSSLLGVGPERGECI